MLACLTGNVGISGGNSGSREGFYTMPFVRLPVGENPIKAKIPIFMWTDAVTRGKEMTALTDGLKGAEKLNQPIKFILNYAGNCIINQHSDINRTLDILQDESMLEMLVVIDNHMTSTEKCADILLPDCTTSEQMDFCMDGSAGNFERVEQGLKPMCVKSCPLRALDLLPIDELKAKYGEIRDVAPLPDSSYTQPNIALRLNNNAKPTNYQGGFLANPKEV
ncbi:hypothetical protein JT17_01180 [Glaesserella parasuis]|nr:hypothetical protein JT17_01180 [Glaesserella parasuis]